MTSEARDDVDLYKRALKHLETGALDEAVVAISAAIARNGDVAWYHQTLGEAYERQRQWAGARQAYARALQLNPVSPKYRQAMTRVSAQWQADAQVISAVAGTVARVPGSPATKAAFGTGAAAPVPIGIGPTSGRAKPRLLVVEDSKVTRTWYESVLRLDYQLSFATTARGALRAVAAHQPALILLDWELDAVEAAAQHTDVALPADLPDLATSSTGLDVCVQIKRSGFQHIPVLMLTSKKGLINKTRSKLARADRFLTKPVSAETLTATIRELLSAARTEPATGPADAAS